MPETVTSNQPGALRPGGPPVQGMERPPWSAGPTAETSPTRLPRARDDTDAPPYTGPLPLRLTEAWLEEFMRSGPAPAPARWVPATGWVPEAGPEHQVTVPRTHTAAAMVHSRGSSLSRRLERHGGVLRVVAATLIALTLLGATLVIRGDVGVGRSGVPVPPVDPAAAPQVASPPPADAAAPEPVVSVSVPAPSEQAPAAAELPIPAPPVQPAPPGQPAAPPNSPPAAGPPADPGPPAAAPGPPVFVSQAATPGRIQARGCPVDHARVEAVISSESPLTSVRLYWADPASGEARFVPMSQVGDTWVGRIGPVEAPGAVYWKIDARDAQNRLTSGPTARLPVLAC